MKNAIITGATGAIGMALIKKLNSEGIHVFVVCRPNSLRANRIIDNKELITKVSCDMSEIERLPFLINESCDIFFHLAWEGTDTPENRINVELQIKNIDYTVKAVKSAFKLNCSVFLGAGSQAEFGNVGGVIYPDMIPNPTSAYGIAKLCTKQATALLCKDLGIRHIWPRILSVYGPYMRDNTLLSAVINKVRKNEIPLLTECNQIWDYLYSSDAAEALYLLALNGKSESNYVLGSGKAYKLKFYAETIRDFINPKCELGFGKIPYRPDQVMHLEADISSITQDVGWIPKVDFAVGIRKILNNNM